MRVLCIRPRGSRMGETEAGEPGAGWGGSPWGVGRGLRAALTWPSAEGRLDSWPRGAPTPELQGGCVHSGQGWGWGWGPRAEGGQGLSSSQLGQGPLPAKPQGGTDKAPEGGRGP